MSGVREGSPSVPDFWLQVAFDEHFWKHAVLSRYLQKPDVDFRVIEFCIKCTKISEKTRVILIIASKKIWPIGFFFVINDVIEYLFAFLKKLVF